MPREAGLGILPLELCSEPDALVNSRPTIDVRASSASVDQLRVSMSPAGNRTQSSGPQHAEQLPLVLQVLPDSMPGNLEIQPTSWDSSCCGPDGDFGLFPAGVRITGLADWAGDVELQPVLDVDCGPIVFTRASASA